MTAAEFQTWCDAMGRPGTQLAAMLGVCYATFCTYRKSGPPPQSARLVELACTQLLGTRPRPGESYLYIVEGCGRDREGTSYRWFDGADMFGSAVDAAMRMEQRLLAGGTVRAYRADTYTDVSREVALAVSDARHAEDMRTDRDLERIR